MSFLSYAILKIKYERTISMSKMIEKLNNIIAYYEEEVQAFQHVLQSAKEQYEKVESRRLYLLQSHIEEVLEKATDKKQSIENQKEIFENINRTTPIEVMFFDSYKEEIGIIQMQQIQRELQQFSSVPFLTTIYKGYKNEGLLYTSAAIDDDEAQAIWDYIQLFQYDEVKEKTNWEYGTLLIWDGTDVVKKESQVV